MHLHISVRVSPYTTGHWGLSVCNAEFLISYQRQCRSGPRTTKGRRNGRPQDSQVVGVADVGMDLKVSWKPPNEAMKIRRRDLGAWLGHDRHAAARALLVEKSN